MSNPEASNETAKLSLTDAGPFLRVVLRTKEYTIEGTVASVGDLDTKKSIDVSGSGPSSDGHYLIFGSRKHNAIGLMLVDVNDATVAVYSNGMDIGSSGLFSGPVVAKKKKD